MTDRQNEKLNMHQTVLNYCREHAEAYAGVPAFVRCVDELEGGVADVRLTVEYQSGVAVKGSTAQKIGSEELLVQACLTVAGALYVYAFENKNAELLEKVSINKNSFYKVSDNQALSLAKNIAKKADKYAGELANYGVTNVEREALEVSIAGFEAVLVSPRSSINERKQHTGNLSQLIAANDSLLFDKLDKLAIRFKHMNPEFFKGYGNARNINTSYMRHRGNGNNNNENPAPEKE